MTIIQLNPRQLKIIDIVKENEPITSESIASILNVTRIIGYNLEYNFIIPANSLGGKITFANIDNLCKKVAIT